MLRTARPVVRTTLFERRGGDTVCAPSSIGKKVTCSTMRPGSSRQSGLRPRRIHIVDRIGRLGAIQRSGSRSDFGCCPPQHPSRRGGQRSRSDGERGAAYQQPCAILPGVRRGSARQPSPRATRWVSVRRVRGEMRIILGHRCHLALDDLHECDACLGQEPASNPSVMLGVGSDAGSLGRTARRNVALTQLSLQQGPRAAPQSSSTPTPRRAQRQPAHPVVAAEPGIATGPVR